MAPKSAVVTLSFCDKCSALRLREVKDQLQQLFSKKSIIRPHQCGICNKDTSPELRDDSAIPLSKYRKRKTNAEKEDNITVEDNSAKLSHYSIKRKKNTKHSTSDDASHSIKQEAGRTDEVVGIEDESQSHEVAINYFKGEDGSSGSDVADDDTMDVDQEASSETESKICSRPHAHVDQEAGVKVESNSESPPLAHRKVTRLSTGAINAKQYLTKVSEIDGDEDFIPDDDDDVDDANDSDDSLEKIARASKTENLQDTDIKTTPKRHGLKGINLEILAMTTPSDDPKRLFKCKLCVDMYFMYLSAFQQHIKTHTGKEPMEKPYKCDVCGNDFKTLTLQSTHKVIHSDRSEAYKCSIRWCKFTYSNKRDFKCHLETHRGTKPHKCKMCGLGFSTKARLTIHLTIHSDDRPFACEYCSKTFSHRRLLTEHVITHTQANRFKCELCDFTCRSNSHLKIHTERHKNRGTFVCAKCQQVFKYQIFLDKHMELNNCKPPKPPAQKRSEVGYDDIDISEITKWLDPRILAMMDRPRSSNSPFKCKQCPAAREFKNAYPFLKHMNNTHSEEYVVKKPFLCAQCDTSFTRFSTLQVHIMTHSDIRPHTCPECNKSFKSKQTLHHHEKTHKEKQHMCSICGTLFLHAAKLKIHVASVHMRLRPHKCEHCDKTFSDKIKKQHHIKRLHEDSRPWICETCGKGFKMKDDLASHSRTHTGKKPYACELCDYRCIRSDYLRKHRRIHTGEKPHHCDICSSKFTGRTSLVLHKKNHHSDETPGPPLTVPEEAVAACNALLLSS